MLNGALSLMPDIKSLSDYGCGPNMGVDYYEHLLIFKDGFLSDGTNITINTIDGDIIEGVIWETKEDRIALDIKDIEDFVDIEFSCIKSIICVRAWNNACEEVTVAFDYFKCLPSITHNGDCFVVGDDVIIKKKGILGLLRKEKGIIESIDGGVIEINYKYLHCSQIKSIVTTK